MEHLISEKHTHVSDNNSEISRRRWESLITLLIFRRRFRNSWGHFFFFFVSRRSGRRLKRWWTHIPFIKLISSMPDVVTRLKSQRSPLMDKMDKWTHGRKWLLLWKGMDSFAPQLTLLLKGDRAELGWTWAVILADKDKWAVACLSLATDSEIKYVAGSRRPAKSRHKPTADVLTLPSCAWCVTDRSRII